MGEIDDKFFMSGMQSSVPRSPKPIAKQAGPNHQLMKKIGELQVEIDQYKNIIKSMTDEIQRTEQSTISKLELKDQ